MSSWEGQWAGYCQPEAPVYRAARARAPGARPTSPPPGSRATFALAKAPQDVELGRAIFWRRPSDVFDSRSAAVLADIRRFLEMDARNHGVAQEVWPALLHAAFPELPQTLEAMLLALVLSGLRHRDVVSAESLADFLEYFAGQGELTCQCLRIGLQGFAMDVEYDGQHDVTTPAGLRLGLRLLWKIRQGGLVWLGTPCSSFVALCQSHARRYEDTCFLGDGRRDFVASGNLLMAISALLGLLAFWLDATPILEQPLTSVMPLAPPLSTVFAFVGARKVVTYHGAFGAPTLKPLQLWSPSGISGALRRDRPRVRPDQHLARRQGDSYTGDKEALHVSQAYTPAFGRAVAAMIQRHLSRLGAQ